MCVNHELYTLSQFILILVSRTQYSLTVESRNKYWWCQLSKCLNQLANIRFILYSDLFCVSQFINILKWLHCQTTLKTIMPVNMGAPSFENWNHFFLNKFYWIWIYKAPFLSLGQGTNDFFFFFLRRNIYRISSQIFFFFFIRIEYQFNTS